MKKTKYKLSNVVKYVDDERKARSLERLGYKKVEEPKPKKKEEAKNTKGGK